MPIYEYTCRNCGADFDMLRSIRDKDDDIECPYCGEKQAERQMSVTTASDAVRKFGSGGWGGGGCTRFG